MLKKVDGRYEFKSEAALETFIYGHLDQLFSMQPIAKQHRVKNDICDILAVDNRQKLSILELKNTEDRYLVQQLTRYYDSYIEEKPFSPLINYSESIRLIAISPSFHQHNLIDRKYTNLPFEFWGFSVTQTNDKKEFLFKLTNYDNSEHVILPISTKNNKETFIEEEKKEGEETDLTTVESPVSDLQQYLMDNATQMDAVDYYIRLHYSSILGIETLTAEETRLNSKKYKRARTKEFTLKLEIESGDGETDIKYKKIKMPQNINLGHVGIWCKQKEPPTVLHVSFNQRLIFVRNRRY
jgi:RecB family endonuclease NucS